jgi:hypothetical protein
MGACAAVGVAMEKSLCSQRSPSLGASIQLTVLYSNPTFRCTRDFVAHE